jgi:hypothetical protein
VHTRVENAAGTLNLSPSTMLFIPAVSGAERTILSEHWRLFVGDQAAKEIFDRPVWDPADYSPWWWLPTMDSLKAMCKTVGFRQLDEGLTWDGNAYVQLLTVT